MNRKPGKTRGPNAAEKRYMAWVAEQPCCICNTPGPSIVDHMYSSTFKHNKVLIGMWALLPYCYTCDQVKTQGSHNAHFKAFGVTQADLWRKTIREYTANPPADVVDAITDWGK